MRSLFYNEKAKIIRDIELHGKYLFFHETFSLFISLTTNDFSGGEPVDERAERCSLSRSHGSIR